MYLAIITLENLMIPLLLYLRVCFRKTEEEKKETYLFDD